MLVAGWTADKINTVVDTIRKEGGAATAVVVGGTRDQVIKLFDKAMADDANGTPADLFVFNMGNNAAVDFREMTAQHFEDLEGRLLRGLPVWTGSDAPAGAAGAGHGAVHRGLGLAARPAAIRGVQCLTKGGLRLLVQSMAREFGPQGIHVAHVIIDGGIEGDRLLSRMPDRVEKVLDGLLKVDAIVENYWHVHCQHRSAWTHEIDLRPYKETPGSSIRCARDDNNAVIPSRRIHMRL